LEDLFRGWISCCFWEVTDDLDLWGMKLVDASVFRVVEAEGNLGYP
jgi:hypothetical protein